MKLSENFSLNEFTVTSTGLSNNPGPVEIDNLTKLVKFIFQPLRNYLKKPITITSGFRSDAVNKKIGGAATSQHRKGEAADFKVEGMTNEEIIEAVRYLNLPYDQLIDEQVGGKSWIHISYSEGKNRGEYLTARGESGRVQYSVVSRKSTVSPVAEKKKNIADQGQD